MKVYPSFRYHKEHGSKIVKSHGEHEALGVGWHDSPAKFEQESKADDAKQDQSVAQSEQAPAESALELAEASEEELEEVAAKPSPGNKKHKGKSRA